MPSLNQVTLIGRLTADPTLRYTASGTAQASFTLAVDRIHAKADGKKTDFFRLKAWARTAEFVNEHVDKGRLIAITGRIELNEHTPDDGIKRFYTDIIVDRVETLDAPKVISDSKPSQGGPDEFEEEDFDAFG